MRTEIREFPIIVMNINYETLKSFYLRLLIHHNVNIDLQMKQKNVRERAKQLLALEVTPVFCYPARLMQVHAKRSYAAGNKES